MPLASVLFLLSMEFFSSREGDFPSAESLLSLSLFLGITILAGSLPLSLLSFFLSTHLDTKKTQEQNRQEDSDTLQMLLSTLAGCLSLSLFFSLRTVLFFLLFSFRVDPGLVSNRRVFSHGRHEAGPGVSVLFFSTRHQVRQPLRKRDWLACVRARAYLAN